MAAGAPGGGVTETNMPNGFVFVGSIEGDGPSIMADVWFNGDLVSLGGPLYFTLDQWQKLRNLSTENDGENPLWATTEVEYLSATGAAVGA